MLNEKIDVQQHSVAPEPTKAPLLDQVASLVEQANVSSQDTIASMRQFFLRFEGPSTSIEIKEEGQVDAPADAGSSQKLLRLLGQHHSYLNELHTLALRLEGVA